jgi:hypothetical protein
MGTLVDCRAIEASAAHGVCIIESMCGEVQTWDDSGFGRGAGPCLF